MSSQYGQTEFWELTPGRNGGPKFRITPDGQTTVREYLVKGDPLSVRQAHIDFLGYSEVRQGVGGKYISRTLPHSIAEYRRPKDNRLYFWASGVNVVEGWNPQLSTDVLIEGFLPNFQLCRMQVTYTAYRYAILSDTEVGTGGQPDEGRLLRFISKFVRPFARTLTLPRQLMRWVPEAGETSVPVVEGTPIQEPGQDLTYIHHQRPDYPRGRLAEALGAVNSTEFDGYPAGTLLCEPAEATPIILPNGDPGYDVSFKFKYLPRRAKVNPFTERGHNWFPKYLPASGTWDYRRMTADGTANGTPPYPSYDFHNLFRPDA